MVLLLDADALIKLYRAGVLQHVAHTFECVIPEGIFHEVVTSGRQFQYPDAESINQVIESDITVHRVTEVPPDILEVPGVDAGERDLLGLFYTLSVEAEAIIISDDRRFLAVLGHEEIPALTPPDLVVLMARQDYLERPEAKTALEDMRPSIRETAYRQALADIEAE